MRFSFNQLERLFARHHKEFFVAAVSITRNRAAAEDAVHDALLAVATGSTRPDDLKAYMFRVVRNKALLYLQQAKRFSDTPPADEFIAAEALQEEDRIFLNQLLRQIEELEFNQQQVLVLKLIAGLTFAEIAETMDSPLNTVTSWYRRGLQKLQEKLDE